MLSHHATDISRCDTDILRESQHAIYIVAHRPVATYRPQENCFLWGPCGDITGRFGAQLWDGGTPGIACAREAEESPALEAVAKKRLVNRQQDGKGLAGAVVICELWRLAVAL
jgi:hypothetical protein